MEILYSWNNTPLTCWVWCVAKKMKRPLTQGMSDVPKDTDPIGGKIDQIIPLSLDNCKAGKEGGDFPL